MRIDFFTGAVFAALVGSDQQVTAVPISYTTKAEHEIEMLMA